MPIKIIKVDTGHYTLSQYQLQSPGSSALPTPTLHAKHLQSLRFLSFSQVSLSYITSAILAAWSLGSWSSLGSLYPFGLLSLVLSLLFISYCPPLFFLSKCSLFCWPFSAWTFPNASGCGLPHI